MSHEGQSFLEFLDDDGMPELQDGSWQIQNDAMAIWAVRKIAQAKAAVESRAATVLAEMVQLTRWLEQAQRQASHDEAFFEGKLHGYLLRLKAEGKLGKNKSWALPNGRLQLTSTPARYEPVDAAAVLAYAREHEAITVKPNMTVIRDLCANGVEVPGMALARQAMETFSVRLTDDQPEG